MKLEGLDVAADIQSGRVVLVSRLGGGKPLREDADVIGVVRGLRDGRKGARGCAAASLEAVLDGDSLRIVVTRGGGRRPARRPRQRPEPVRGTRKGSRPVRDGETLASSGGTTTRRIVGTGRSGGSSGRPLLALGLVPNRGTSCARTRLPSLVRRKDRG